MGEAVGSMLASAVAVALSPLPLITVILILATPRGRTKGLAFTAGWVLGLAVPVAVTLAVGSALNRVQTTPTWSSWLKLALGALLLLSAARQWHDRPRAGHVTAPPAWLQGIDRFSPARSAGLALALVARSPRSLLPAVGGAASIAATATGTGAEAVAAALLVSIGSLCTLLPLAVHPRDGARTLGEWRAWTATHQAAVLTTVPAVLGAEYLGDAVSGLT
ncbi:MULTISPECIES: GAP family protein [unclassified Kitasatospora]|uniref:GAP family protein n=1 Tax=unclassified Kitasatospora TaxID=2633591 RepID=UPI0033CA10D8